MKIFAYRYIIYTITMFSVLFSIPNISHSVYINSTINNNINQKIIDDIEDLIESTEQKRQDDVRNQDNSYRFIVSMTKAIFGFLLVFTIFWKANQIIHLILDRLNRESVHTARDVISVTGLVLIVFAIIAVVLLVETQQIISTAIGVLGTIAGYLFGTVQERLITTSPPNPALGNDDDG